MLYLKFMTNSHFQLVVYGQLYGISVCPEGFFLFLKIHAAPSMIGDIGKNGEDVQVLTLA